MKRFTVRNEEFICQHCGYQVQPLSYTSRDHCPSCLYSKHVDINPGDRANGCLGMLVPRRIEKFKDTFKIVYQCDKCKEFHRNIIANDDNMDLIIELSKNPY